MDNSLTTFRETQAKENLAQRVSDLEDRLENIEAVLVSLCESQKKSRSWPKYLGGFYLRRPKTKPKVSEDEGQKQTTGAK